MIPGTTIEAPQSPFNATDGISSGRYIQMSPIPEASRATAKNLKFLVVALLTRYSPEANMADDMAGMRHSPTSSFKIPQALKLRSISADINPTRLTSP